MMCSLDSAMPPTLSIICESERQVIGFSVREKLERIGFVTEIQWQEDEGLKTSFYNASAVVACVSTTNSNNIHLVPEIERAAYAHVPVIAVLIDEDFDPNDQGSMSMIQLIKARAVVDFHRDGEFEGYFEELYKQWTMNVPERERVEKGTDVKDENFPGDEEKEADDNERNDDKEEICNDGEEVDEDDSLNQKEEQDEGNDEREVEEKDAVTVEVHGEDEQQGGDEDAEKGQKEDEETEEVGTEEPGDDKQTEKDAEIEEHTCASNTEDPLPNEDTLPNEDAFPPNEDIPTDDSTAPNDDIGSTDVAPNEETIPPNEDTEQETFPGEDAAPEVGLVTGDDIPQEEDATGDKDNSLGDGNIPEEDATLVEPSEDDATKGWDIPGNENFSDFHSNIVFQERNIGFHQTEPEENLKEDLFPVEEGETLFEEKVAA